MKCPKCGQNECIVIDSRPKEDHTYRRRSCYYCQHRFSTFEISEDEYEKLKEVAVTVTNLMIAAKAVTNFL